MRFLAPPQPSPDTDSIANGRAVFEMSPIIVGLVSLPDGRFVEVNASGLAALGYSREEVIGRKAPELQLVDEATTARLRGNWLALHQFTGGKLP